VLMNQLSALKDYTPNNIQLAANTIIARPSTLDILDSCINFEKVCLQLFIYKEYIFFV
jgi:hypothetical protein